MSNLETNEEGELLGQILQAKGITRTLIDSYNNVISHRIPKIIEAKRLTTNDGKVITLTNPFFTRPTTNDKSRNNEVVPLYPYAARMQMGNYMAKIFVKLTFNTVDEFDNLIPIPARGNQPKQETEILLGKIPVMIGSELDHLSNLSEKERAEKGEPEKDAQGYFIMHQERVLLNIERLRTNTPYLYDDKGIYTVRYTSKTLFDTTIVVLQELKNGLHISFSGMEQKTKVDLFVIFFALGLKQDTVNAAIQIMESFINDADPVRLARRKKELRQYLKLTVASFNETSKGVNPDIIARILSDKFKKTALTKSAKQLTEVEELVKKSIFKNIKYPPSRVNKTEEQFKKDVAGVLKAKMRMLAYMAVKYIEFKNCYRQPDDRDNWANKMVEDAGRHIEVRFIDLFNTLIEDAQKKINKSKIENIANVKSAINHNLIGEQFERSFVRGLWSNFKTAKPLVVVDILNRDNLLATPAHLRRITAPINRQAMMKQKRTVSLSSWGFICPAATPEGANCCSASTPIQMADGSSKQIGTLKDGDWIITVNPATFEKEPTQIYNHFVRQASAHGRGLYKITTINGRTITATGDHAFLTQAGWVDAQNLDKNIHKVILAQQVNELPKSTNQNIILNENLFRSILDQCGIADNLIDKYTRELTTMNLLPLYTHDQRLPIIARVYGFEITDGSLSIAGGSPQSSFSFGTKYDAETFNNDLKLIGFSSNSISYDVGTQTAPDGRQYTHHTWNTTKSGSFAALLLSLGSSYGRRVVQYTAPIPSFVMNGSKDVQREFLAGFQGGDGGAVHAYKRPDKVKAFHFGISPIQKTRTQEHLQSLVFMMNQYAQLLQSFGIEISRVDCDHYYDDRWHILIHPADAEANIIRYMDTIGYRYAMSKQSKGFYIAEFLRYKQVHIERRDLFKQRVLHLYHVDGLKQSDVARELEVTLRKVGSVIENEDHYPGSRSLPPKDTMGMEQWEQLIPCANDCILVPIYEIERLTEDIMVSDFTTVSNHHSMISAGFVTHNCGLVKDAAITTYISLERDDSYVHSLLLRFLDVSPRPEIKQINSLFLNGVHLGYIDSQFIQQQALDWRRTQQIAFDTGIVLDIMNDLWIYTNGGRLCRPILTVETDNNGISIPVIDKLKLRGQSIKTLMDKGALEYIDAAEQQNPKILIATVKSKIENSNSYVRTAFDNAHFALEELKTNKVSEKEKNKFVEIAEKALADPKYTHMEIDPTVIFGLSTIVIPLPESMPGPRVTYQAAMGKQALGPNSIRNELRYETTVKLINQPGVPFTATDIHERLGLNKYPSGANIILMISTAWGYNQEDAIVFNRGSIQRGLFRHTVYHSYKTVVSSNDELRLPDKKSNKFSKLDERGVIRIGSTVVPGDALISKVTKDNSDKKNIVFRDTTLYAEIGKEGIVDDIIEINNPGEEGGILIRIRLRETREPIEGDKFASRYAQKGVIGKIVPEENMPFITSSDPFLNGVRPDIIFNPHGIPSRMTVPKLLEVILGRIVAMTGIRINVTAFRRFNMVSFMDKLQDMGMNRAGTERFINGETGRMIETMIFTGPVYYQQLRHMVRDKAQARGRGAVQYLTRQPVSGIRKKGGLRTGHMEISAMLEHGATSLLQERTSKSSDAHNFTLCVPCGKFAVVSGISSEVTCRSCGTCDKMNFRRIEMPYSMKLLSSLLSIGNIKLKYVIPK